MIAGRVYELTFKILGTSKSPSKKRMKFLGEINNELFLFKHPKGYKECFLKKMNNIDYKIKEC